MERNGNDVSRTAHVTAGDKVRQHLPRQTRRVDVPGCIPAECAVFFPLLVVEAD